MAMVASQVFFIIDKNWTVVKDFPLSYLKFECFSVSQAWVLLTFYLAVEGWEFPSVGLLAFYLMFEGCSFPSLGLLTFSIWGLATLTMLAFVNLVFEG